MTTFGHGLNGVNSWYPKCDLGAPPGHAHAFPIGAQECLIIELTLLFLVQFSKSQVVLFSLIQSKNYLTKLTNWACPACAWACLGCQ